MDLNKFNTIIWSIIGAFILFGVLLGTGSAAIGLFSYQRHHADGIAAPAAPDTARELSPVLKTVYEMPLITEGSDYFIIPVSLKKVTPSRESGRYSARASDSSSWESRSYTAVDYMDYNYFNRPCHNLIFINKKDGHAEKLLHERAYIASISFPKRKSAAEEKTKPSFILMKIGKTDTNGDGTINDNDALAGYLTSLDGRNLTQITPSDANMTSWQYDQDSKKLFVRIIEALNNDKQFNEDDQEKIMVVDTEMPGMGQEFVPASIKKEIESVLR